MDHAAFPDLHMIADKGAGIDKGSLPDLRERADGLHSAFEGTEMPYDLQVGFERIVDHQQSLARRAFHHFIDNDERRGGLQALVVILGMVHKNQVAFFYFMDLIDAGSGSLRFPDQGSAKKFR
jgi:hypothetical protein